MLKALAVLVILAIVLLCNLTLYVFLNSGLLQEEAQPVRWSTLTCNDVVYTTSLPIGLYGTDYEIAKPSGDRIYVSKETCDPMSVAIKYPSEH